MRSQMLSQLRYLLPLIVLTQLLHSCGLVEEPVSSTSCISNCTNSTSSSTGVFVDSEVNGVTYTTSSGLSGTTNASGQFSYQPGDTASFSIGDVDLGTVTASSVLTPVEIMGATGTADQKVINLSRLLQTLDSDGDASNGIEITSTTSDTLKGKTLDFDIDIDNFTNHNTISQIQSAVGRTLISATSALNHLHTTLSERSLNSKISSDSKLQAMGGTLSSFTFTPTNTLVGAAIGRLRTELEGLGSLTKEQIKTIIDAGKAKLDTDNLGESDNPTAALPSFLKGAMKGIGQAGLSSESTKQAIRITTKVVTSLIGRFEKKLANSRTERTATRDAAFESLLGLLTEIAIDGLADTGLPPDELDDGFGEIVGSMVGNLDEAGAGADGIGSAVQVVVQKAMEKSASVDGMNTEDAIQSMTKNAVQGLGQTKLNPAKVKSTLSKTVETVIDSLDDIDGGSVDLATMIGKVTSSSMAGLVDLQKDFATAPGFGIAQAISQIAKGATKGAGTLKSADSTLDLVTALGDLSKEVATSLGRLTTDASSVEKWTAEILAGVEEGVAEIKKERPDLDIDTSNLTQKIQEGVAAIPAPCNFGGTQIPGYGDQITAYLTPSVPYGSKCQSEQRSCNDGTLLPINSGYQHPSCKIEDQPKIAEEPAYNVKNFIAHVDNTSTITTRWELITDQAGQAPEGFLIFCNRKQDPGITPLDGKIYIEDNQCADGSGSVYVGSEQTQFTWSGLHPNQDYFFAIGSFTNAGTANIDYLQSEPAFASGRTPPLDNIAPTLSDVSIACVTNIDGIATTTERTPRLLFNSSEDGTLAMAGPSTCTTSQTNVRAGNNGIRLDNFTEDGSYLCAFNVTDDANNKSSMGTTGTFKVDSHAPAMDNFTISNIQRNQDNISFTLDLYNITDNTSGMGTGAIAYGVAFQPRLTSDNPLGTVSRQIGRNTEMIEEIDPIDDISFDVCESISAAVPFPPIWWTPLPDSYTEGESVNEIHYQFKPSVLSATLTPANYSSLSVTLYLKDKAGHVSIPYQKVIDIPPVDVTPPSIVSVSPQGSIDNQSMFFPIKITFSEEMDNSTINSDNILVKNMGIDNASGSWSYSDGVATFEGVPSPIHICTQSFPGSCSTSVQVTVSTNVKDISGNPLLTEYSWTIHHRFTTSPPLEPLEIITYSPLTGTVSLTDNITIQFNKKLDNSTVNSNNFSLIDNTTGNLVSGDWLIHENGSLVTYNPTDDLKPGTVYTVTVNKNLKDTQGDSLITDYSWSFITPITPTNFPYEITTFHFDGIDGTSSSSPRIKIDFSTNPNLNLLGASVLFWKNNEEQTWVTASEGSANQWEVNHDLGTSASAGTYSLRTIKLSFGGWFVEIDADSLSGRGFTVSDNIQNTMSDDTEPTLQNVGAITVETIPAGTAAYPSYLLKYSVQFIETDSVLEKAFSYLQGPGGALIGDYATIENDIAHFEFPLDGMTGSGEYKISDIRLYDQAGNLGFYDSSNLTTGGFQITKTLNNPNSDDTPPTITGLTLSSEAVGSNHAIFVEVETDQQVSELEHVYIRLSSQTHTEDRYLDTINLDHLNRRSTKIIPPSQFSTDNFTIDFIWLTDKALNKREYNTSELQSLGFPTTINPTDVSGGSSLNILKISAGGFHTCAVLSDQTIKCWGSNRNGQIGDGATTESWTPVNVPDISTATTIAAGSTHTCALLIDNTIKCWGDGSEGQIGDGINNYGPVMTPSAVSGISNATAIYAGVRRSCAIVDNGTVKCWGAGYLGDGSGNNSNTPVTVNNISNITKVSVGGNPTCALHNSGSVYCWGNSFNGELGNGMLYTGSNPHTSSIPVLVTGISTAEDLFSGAHHTCAIVNNGNIRCWGKNNYGQLGDATNTNQSTPVDVAGITNAIAVSNGLQHSCALLDNGSIQCWGWNEYGQLGDGSTTDRSTPVNVSGVSTATSIATGYEHTCALLDDNTIKCWGRNMNGQLGTGTNTDSYTPIFVTGFNASTGGGDSGGGGSGGGTTASCTFNNQTIDHNASVTAYEAETVSFGSSCNAETRTCNNGSLSGTFGYSSCQVQTSNQDTEYPEITSISLGSNTVEQGTAFSVNIEATDDVSGVSRVEVGAGGPSNLTANSAGSNEYGYSYSPSNGIYSAILNIDQFDETGEWFIGYFRVFDNSDKRTDYYYRPAENQSFYLKPNPDGSYTTTSFPILKFTVTGVDQGTNPPEEPQGEDRTPPVISSISLASNTVVPGESFKVNIQATDDNSGIQFVSASALGPFSIENNQLQYEDSASGIAYSTIDGYYSPNLSIEVHDKPGEWVVSSFYVRDKWDNLANYSLSTSLSTTHYSKYNYDTGQWEADNQFPLLTFNVSD